MGGLARGKGESTAGDEGKRQGEEGSTAVAKAGERRRKRVQQGMKAREVEDTICPQ